jgi:hypothetical protein
MKLDKAGHLFEVAVARQPDLLESLFGSPGDLETIHGDKHQRLLLRLDAFDCSAKNSIRPSDLKMGLEKRTGRGFDDGSWING